MPARNFGAPVLVAALVALLAATARPQTTPLPAASPLDRLAEQTLRHVLDRVQRPLGRVIDRRRSRVFVAVAGEAPPPGTELVASRPNEKQPSLEERIATLRVLQVSPGVLECTETPRRRRRHVKEGDIVRLQRQPLRVLLAPCVSLMDLPVSIPQILAEKLRRGLRASAAVQLVIDPDRETRAAAAYRRDTLPGFLQQQEDLDEVLVPALLLTAEKLILNLEAFSVSRRGAIEVAAAAVELDGVLRPWIAAGVAAPKAPPGFRLLSSQLFPWRPAALGHGDRGVLAVTPDSLFLLRFDSPGLRPVQALPLGPKVVARRAPSVLVLQAAILNLAAPDLAGNSLAWILSEERWPRALLPGESPHRLEWGGAVAGGEIRTALQSIWKHAGGARDPADGSQELASRWWPAPGRGQRAVILPVFADLDGNGRLDLMWNDRRGHLCVFRALRGQTDLYAGFGDVKAVQPRSEPDWRPVLWLTDDVCCGASDRLHAAQLDGARLRLVWSSEGFAAPLVAVASGDLDGDGAFDLVLAEEDAAGARLHVFMAIPGERTPARGVAVSRSGSK